MKLAMLQIFRLAPSISPDMELVVSSANTTSTWGRLAGATTAGVSAGFAVAGAIRTTVPPRSSKAMAGAAARRWAPSAASPAIAAPPTIAKVSHRRFLGGCPEVCAAFSVVPPVVVVRMASPPGLLTTADPGAGSRHFVNCLSAA